MMQPAAHGYPISLDDLSIEYPPHGPSPAHVAVHGVALDVAPGEVIGVLGSAGSGKSTLARVLAGRGSDAEYGEVRPIITGGSGVVLGHELRGASKRRLAELAAHVGYLPQDASARLRSDRTVAELVAEPVLERDRRYNERALAMRVATMIDSVRLPLSVLDRFPYELSAGQRQRVALARALMLGPSLLVADEPSAGIDLTVRDVVAQLVVELCQQQSFSAIVITHDLPVLHRIADRIAVFDGGTLIALGTIEDVLGDPVHPYVKALAGALDDGHAVIEEVRQR